MDISREPRGAKERGLCLQTDSSAQDQLLCKTQQGWVHCLHVVKRCETESH